MREVIRWVLRIRASPSVALGGCVHGAMMMMSEMCFRGRVLPGELYGTRGERCGHGRAERLQPLPLAVQHPVR